IAERRPDFRWVCETFWGVEQFLARATEDERTRFVHMLQAGRIGLSSNYLNFSELAGPEVLTDVCARADAFARMHDLRARSALTCDINGFGWGFADALLDGGAEHLFTCVHTHHGRYPLERPQQGFWWEASSGRRLLVWSGEHYHFGNELGLAPGACASYLTKDDCDADMIFHDAWGVAERRIPRYWQRLEEAGYALDAAPVMISGLRTDNGPPSEAILDQIERWNAAHGSTFPVRMATLDAWFEQLRHHADDLPVHRGDWPDWWSDGPFSMPRGVRVFREAQRDLRRARALGAPNDQETVTQLALFAEHTFGHSDSIGAPWHPLAQGLAARKEAYAAIGAELAAEQLEQRLGHDGAAELEPELPFAWRVRNPTDEPVAGLAELVVVHHEYADRSVDDRVVVRRTDTGEVLPFERAPVPRGMAFLVPLTLAPGASVDLQLEPHAGEPPEDDVRELAAIETPFVRIELDADSGIAAMIDRRTGRDLLRSDREHAPFQPVHEQTPCDDADRMLAVRGAMRLDRKGEGFQRSAGVVTRVEPVRAGPVRQTARIHYALEGAQHVVLELTAHVHAPRVDAVLRMQKLGSWAPENLYLALPFTAGASEEFWVGKPGCVLRPWIDQVPGTLTDFTCVDEAIAWTAGEGGVALTLRDHPLVQLGPLDPGPRRLAGDEDLPPLPTQIYAWLMNNMWETNFVADLGGFHEFRTTLTWDADLASPQTAVDRGCALALDLTAYRLARVPSAAGGRV
nr:glycoside hydrolase [Planctomycetota bacterium]